MLSLLSPFVSFSSGKPTRRAPPAQRMSLTAVARALHRQNGWLRQRIELEAQSIASLSAGKLRARMTTYNAALLAAVDGNASV